MKRSFDSIDMTLWGALLLLLLCVFHATTDTNHAWVFYALLIGVVVGSCAVLFHLVLVFIRPSRPMGRVLHLGCAASVALILVWVIPASVERHFLGLRWAFLQKRVHEYDAMMDRIKSNRALLTGGYTEVSSLVGRPFVYARTNQDGSLSARFFGRVDGGRFDSLRVGYEYHDGPMIPKPDNANYFTEPGLRAYGFRLTNGWYEWSK